MNKVLVLMSTYNGEKYIKEQIESILNQEQVEVFLLIRDDGSLDKTKEIIKDFESKNNNITFYEGKNLGPARSFMDLINKAEDFDYYAFSDQDDVWDSKKLISAIEMIKEKNKEKDNNDASLYMSAVEIVDESLNFVETKKASGNFCFEGEMVKNFAIGCTQVFNKALCDEIKKYNPKYLIMHDSWITRVCYAIGGNVIIDDNAYIKYRQHSNNVLGYKDEGFQKLKRQFKIAFKDNISMRVNIAKELKNSYQEMLTDDAKEVIENLINYQKDKKAKKWLLNNKKFKTNDKKINMKMKLAIILNKF